VAGWARSLPETTRPLEVLAIGCGVGSDLIGVKRLLAPRECVLHGIDVYEPSIEKARAAGIAVQVVDVEREPLPFGDSSLDYVIANQVLEHIKEIFWTVSEVQRTLRPDGLFCIGVPNLASFHNRVLLALGHQPTSIQVVGPHVRGFTLQALQRFVETGGFFEIRSVAGTNFYPLPPWAATRAARLWRTGAVSLFLLARRTHKTGTFLDAIDATMAETNFYSGLVQSNLR
jgi:SAM-dependent methyltransferase